MRPIARIAVVVLLVATSGCFPAYKPASGPSATLVSPSGAPVYFYSNERCENPKRWSQNPLRETRTTISVNGPIYVGMNHTKLGLYTSVSCVSTGTFLPVAGGAYSIAIDPTLCELKVFRLDAKGDRQPEGSLHLFKAEPKCADAAK
jgi:hypothetical protein